MPLPKAACSSVADREIDHSQPAASYAFAEQMRADLQANPTAYGDY
jgi:hypothetical protein